MQIVFDCADCADCVHHCLIVFDCADCELVFKVHPLRPQWFCQLRLNCQNPLSTEQLKLYGASTASELWRAGSFDSQCFPQAIPNTNIQGVHNVARILVAIKFDINFFGLCQLYKFR